jgi:1,5-anhydro-D-fructose reductase (1,5-anhydro-D-mannitol-forming)
MIRWGIIGCGDVCEVKSGPAFQKADGSELVAVMRRDAGKCADYARRHGVPKWYTDAQQLIDDPDVDAVYVATPVGTHLHYALQVAAAGKPCYVEKPMARSHAECAAMVEAFERAGQPLFVAYYRRKLPRFEKVKELIDAGRIGTVTAVSVRLAQPTHRGDASRWRFNCEESGGGLFMDLASHTLDVLDHILGAVADVKGFAVNRSGAYEVEDAVAMQFQYESGVIGAGLWDFASAISEDIIEIHGTDGRIVLSTFGNEPVALQLSADRIERFDLPNPPHVHQPLVQTIVDELNGKPGCSCPSTGVSAARTARAMDEALQSYYGRRDDAFWSRPDTWPAPGFRRSARNPPGGKPAS